MILESGDYLIFIEFINVFRLMMIMKIAISVDVIRNAIQPTL